jgi:hypothetical protein
VIDDGREADRGEGVAQSGEPVDVGPDGLEGEEDIGRPGSGGHLGLGDGGALEAGDAESSWRRTSSASL